MRRQLLIAALSCALFAEAPGDRYQPLRRALGMSDSQDWQLTPEQQYKLADISKVLDRFQISARAVALGLIDVRDWPTGWACWFPARAPVSAFAGEFDLSATQTAQLEKAQGDLRQQNLDQLGAMWKRLHELRDSGASDGSPKVLELNSEISKLQSQYWEIRPPRDLVLAMLTDTQRAKLAAFQSELELAREALELHLIRLPGLPEILCH